MNTIKIKLRAGFLRWLDQLLAQVSRYRATQILRQCASVGEGVNLRMPVIVYHPERLTIGSYVEIGEYSLLRAAGGLVIGNRVLIASHVVLATRTHPLTIPRFGITVEGRIVIEDDVWLGAASIVLPNTTIGRGSIVAAGAVVTGNIPPMTVVAGVPARVIREVPVG